MRLIRKFSQSAAPERRMAALTAVLVACLVFLAACQIVPTVTETLPPAETTASAEQTTTFTETQATTGPTTGQSTETSESGTVIPSDTTQTTVEETGATPSPGLTPVNTPTPGATPSFTPSPTARTSPTATPTKKPTTAPTVSPTSRPTSTSTPTPTKKPTSTPTPTPTKKPTSTPTPTPTTAAPTFPYTNYGTFFRNEYGDNSNIITSGDGGVKLDIGSAPQGVVLVYVSESSIPLSKSCKVIATANGKTYQYEILYRDKYLGVPLQMGEGSYTINVYGQISGTSYYSAMGHTFNVDLASSLKPYTASSLMVDFSTGSACVSKANSLCSGLTTTDAKVLAVYNWIAANIDYDTALADDITSGAVTIYVPDPDRTYNSRKGICFDYASLMCAMLRSQGIPTKLAVGQVPQGYHAWNEVYFAGTGWVVVASFNYSYVDGSSWVMFDPTFAASGLSPSKILSYTHTKQKTY